MANTNQSTTTLSGSVTGAAVSTAIPPQVVTNSESPAVVGNGALGAGFISFGAPPPGTKVVVLLVPASQGGTVTLKGVTGDVGIEIAPGGWLAYTPPASTPSTWGVANTTPASDLFTYFYQ